MTVGIKSGTDLRFILQECKSVTHFSFGRVFHSAESPEELEKLFCFLVLVSALSNKYYFRYIIDRAECEVTTLTTANNLENFRKSSNLFV